MVLHLHLQVHLFYEQKQTISVFVFIFFMILAGGNFAVYYNALQRGIRVLIDDFETRMYWLVIFYWNCYNINFDGSTIKY